MAEDRNIHTVSIAFEVKGVQYDGRAYFISLLRAGDPLRFIREPSNPVDRNAIRIEDMAGHTLGYVPRGIAKLYGWIIDQKKVPFTGEVIEVYTRNDDLPGLRARVHIPQIVDGEITFLY